MWPHFQPVEGGIFVSCMIRSNIFWNLLKPSEITIFRYYPLSENLCCVDTKSILLITTSRRNSGSIEGRKNYCRLIKGQLFHIFLGSPRGLRGLGDQNFMLMRLLQPSSIIGCDGKPQPIGLAIENFNQSDCNCIWDPRVHRSGASWW